MAQTNFQVVLVTAPDQELAEHLAKKLVESRSAACVNILPQVRSIYRWEGKIEDSAEVLMIIKTTAERYAQLEALVLSEHSYSVPEIIALDIKAGQQKYLAWLSEQTT